MTLRQVIQFRGKDDVELMTAAMADGARPEPSQLSIRALT